MLDAEARSEQRLVRTVDFPPANRRKGPIVFLRFQARMQKAAGGIVRLWRLPFRRLSGHIRKMGSPVKFCAAGRFSTGFAQVV